MASVLGGLFGGLLGAAVTAAAMRAADVGPAPSATVWAMYFGDGDPDHYEEQGMVVHAIYGTIAGAVFASLAGALSLALGTLGGALLWAVVWAAVLAVIALGFWQLVFVGGMPDARELAELGGVHLVYGIVLGLVVFLASGL